MTLSWKITLGIGAIILTGLGAMGYWYVFIAGAPQLDAPQINVPGSDLTFKLECFNSKTMGEVRQYGLILPPDYEKNRDRSYLFRLLVRSQILCAIALRLTIAQC